MKNPALSAKSVVRLIPYGKCQYFVTQPDVYQWQMPICCDRIDLTIRLNFFWYMIPGEDKGENNKEPTPVAWTTFLETYPPGKIYPVKGVIELDGPFFNIRTPYIMLYCEDASCKRKRIFRYSGLKLSVSIGKKDGYLLRYPCRHCRSSQKTLAVYIGTSSLFGTNRAIKHSEQTRLWNQMFRK